MPWTNRHPANWIPCRRPCSGTSSTNVICATCATCRNVPMCRRMNGPWIFRTSCCGPRPSVFAIRARRCPGPRPVEYGPGRQPGRYSGCFRDRQCRERSGAGRVLLEKTLGVDRTAPVPTYHRQTARKRLLQANDTARSGEIERSTGRGPIGRCRDRVVLFTTCYGNRNLPEICEDLAAVFEHNGITVALAEIEHCCGMPKLELGDLASVARASKDRNISELLELGPGRMGYRGAGSVLRADVQAGAAVAVSGRRIRAGGRQGVFRSVRIPVRVTGRAGSRPTSRRRSARSPTRCLVICGCRISVEDQVDSRARARYAGRCDRAMFRARRDLWRQETVSRSLVENCKAGHQSRTASRNAIIS